MKKISKNPWFYIFIYVIVSLILLSLLLAKPIKKIIVIPIPEQEIKKEKLPQNKEVAKKKV